MMSVHTLVIQKRYDDDHSSIMRLDYNESMLIENALSYAMSGAVFKENSHLIKWLADLRAHNRLIELEAYPPDESGNDDYWAEVYSHLESMGFTTVATQAPR